jgi:hypothetical protein
MFAPGENKNSEFFLHVYRPPHISFLKDELPIV